MPDRATACMREAGGTQISLCVFVCVCVKVTGELESYMASCQLDK